jgi:threonine dehydratase
MADGLRASLSPRTFGIVRVIAGGIATVSEASIVRAMRVLHSSADMVAEPSGAVALAAVLDGKIPVAGLRVGVIVSGGNVSPADFCRATGITL